LEFLIQDTKNTTEEVHKKFEGQLKDLKLMSNSEVENMMKLNSEKLKSLNIERSTLQSNREKLIGQQHNTLFLKEYLLMKKEVEGLKNQKGILESNLKVLQGMSEQE
jgi:hypothetical protein